MTFKELKERTEALEKGVYDLYKKLEAIAVEFEGRHNEEVREDLMQCLRVLVNDITGQGCYYNWPEADLVKMENELARLQRGANCVYVMAALGLTWKAERSDE